MVFSNALSYEFFEEKKHSMKNQTNSNLITKTIIKVDEDTAKAWVMADILSRHYEDFVYNDQGKNKAGVDIFDEKRPIHAYQDLDEITDKETRQKIEHPELVYEFDFFSAQLKFEKFSFFHRIIFLKNKSFKQA